MVLIYSIQITSRLQYIADLIFRELLEVEIDFTTSIDKFYNYDGPKINYTKDVLSEGVHIYPHTLLFEKEIHQQRMDYGEYNKRVTLFSSHERADLPYDPLAASFFLVSRYEEYLPFRADKYGRFRGEKSISYFKSFSNEPLVNHYALHIKELLHKKFPSMVFPAKEYQFILTYDIDIAFRFKGKSLLRSWGSMAKSLLKRDRGFFSLRKSVLSGEEQDPYDTFEDQLSISNTYRVYPVYFFPMGNYSKYDKNISWRSGTLRQWIKKISERFFIGLHPSYSSNTKPKKLEMEIARLNSITGKQIVRSRQHYLKLTFPNTYRTLLALGIQEDWTMGHASILGFRASITSPFFFYDLLKDEQTNLKIFPFAAMDSTLHYYLNLSPKSALEELKLLVNEVKSVQGTFIFIAHNDLISPTSVWKGWSKYFEEFIAYARE